MTAGDTCTVSVTRTDALESPSQQRNSDTAREELQLPPAHDHLWARLRGPSFIFVDLRETDGQPGTWTADVRGR
jgi:hypothetical protein